MQAAFYGLAGERLSDDERAFFREADPVGYILFRRNIADPEQLRALTDDLRTIHGRDDLPILIDQEGGRVARMRPPHWDAFPPAWTFAELYARAPMTAIEAARANAQAIAVMLREAGINVNALPLLDVRQEGAHDIIGDRALGAEPMQVAALGRAVLDGLAAGGVVGIVKHMPGHGRSAVDSHQELPVVHASEEELEIDIAPFRTLAGAPMGMTSHVVYPVWDSERCASLSPTVIGEIIRGRIGFDGFLMSDDIGMHALSGAFRERVSAALEAGCDAALHCSGAMAEMVSAAEGARPLTDAAQARLKRAMAIAAAASEGPSYQELASRRDRLIAAA
jgi:beta-N-acetylhexosaminidase